MKEIEKLDNDWEEAKVTNANLNALKDKEKGLDLENQSEHVKGGKQVDNLNEPKVSDEQEIYKNAWAKQMMGKKIEDNEKEVFDKVNAEFNNAYTHDTGNTGILIPENRRTRYLQTC